MSESTHADRYLLDQIRQGSSAGWSELVTRYQGRLHAFARSRLRRPADADDMVQETFIHFLKGLPRFREDASIETYLFTILRRKLIDWFRGQRVRICSLQDSLTPGDDSDRSSLAAQIPSHDQTASWYARNDEQADQDQAALASALRALLDRYKEADNLRDLRVAEMLFYGQLRNKDIAQLAHLDEKHVALIKHRCLNEIRTHVARSGGEGVTSIDAADAAGAMDSLLTQTWERHRLTCPKRSTLGRYVLGTLEPAWQELIEFHVNRLGCQFCQASLEDLRQQTTPTSPVLHDRILHSTVGFFRHSAT